MLNNIRTVLKSKLFYTLVVLIFIVPFLYEKLPIRVDITQQNSLPQKIWLTYSDLTVESDYVLFIPPKTKYTLSSITSPINNLNYSIILYGKNRCKKIITQRVV